MLNAFFCSFSFVYLFRQILLSGVMFVVKSVSVTPPIPSLPPPQYAPEDALVHAHGPVHAHDSARTLLTQPKEWVCI